MPIMIISLIKGEKSTDSAKPQSNADKPVSFLIHRPTDWQKDIDDIQPQTYQKIKCKISRLYFKIFIDTLDNYYSSKLFCY